MAIFVSLVASEVLLEGERPPTAAASEAWITPGFMVSLDMRLELPLFCGSFPITSSRGIWALLRFCMCLQVLSRILSES